jgi:hypothetical protein
LLAGNKINLTIIMAERNNNQH